MDFLIHTPDRCEVETSKKDWLKAVSYRYNIWLQLRPESQPECVTVYWSATEHYIIDSNNVKYSIPGTGNGNKENEDKINPYGILPAVVLRLKDGITFWGEGQWDLVNANQEICELVTVLAYTAKTQLHGQLVVKDPGGSIKGDLQTGVDWPVHLTGSIEEVSVSSAEYIQANAALVPVQDLIDWYIRAAQSDKGLTPQQFSTESKIASGVSKEIDNTEIEEIRKADMNVITMFEYDLFDVCRVVYNYHNPNNQISTDAVFSIKFQEPKISETQTDKNARMQFELDNHLVSYIDLIIEKNPGMLRDEATAKFKQIVSEMRELNDELGLTDLFNKMENDNSQNNNNQEQPGAIPQNLTTAKG
jgi:hypothetical protein